MSSSNDLVTVPRGGIPRSGLPIAHMRSVYRMGDVERRLDKLLQARIVARLPAVAGANRDLKGARIESGERDPRLSTLRRYAHAVGALIEHSVSSYDHERNLRDERPASRLAAVPAAVRDEQPRAIQQVLA